MRLKKYCDRNLKTQKRPKRTNRKKLVAKGRFELPTSGYLNLEAT